MGSGGRHPTPDTAHVGLARYGGTVYEPAEDTFLLLDALEADLVPPAANTEALRFLEVGSGSGCVVAFAGTLLAAHAVAARLHALDINPAAVVCTRETAQVAGVAVDARLGDVADAAAIFADAAPFDVVAFNPPYVVTDDAECTDADMAARAWAGGARGRRVTDRFLAALADESLLRRGGRAYVLLIEENDPDDVMARARAAGLRGRVVLRRRAHNERQLVIRFDRGKDD